MASLRAAVTVALLLALAQLGTAAVLPNVNGSKDCKYLNPRLVNQLLRAKGVTDAAAISATLARLKSVDNMVCQECKAKRGMEAKFTGAILEGYSECWCAQGFGAFSKTLKNGKVMQMRGCNACPADTTSLAKAGPYKASSRSWNNTPCVKLV